MNTQIMDLFFLVHNYVVYALYALIKMLRSRIDKELKNWQVNNFCVSFKLKRKFNNLKSENTSSIHSFEAYYWGYSLLRTTSVTFHEKK